MKKKKHRFIWVELHGSWYFGPYPRQAATVHFTEERPAPLFYGELKKVKLTAPIENK